MKKGHRTIASFLKDEAVFDRPKQFRRSFVGELKRTKSQFLHKMIAKMLGKAFCVNIEFAGAAIFSLKWL